MCIKVSIIVPVYNVEQYLAECMDSILKQTYGNIEIILVDDGSTDTSGAICDQYSQRDMRVQVIHKANGGLSSARNEGIATATGDLLCFIDSDDYISENMIGDMVDVLTETGAELVICNRYSFAGRKQKIQFPNHGKLLYMDSEHAIEEMNSFRNFDMSACAKLYKKGLFYDIRFPEGKLSEDYFVMYKLFEQADKIVYLPAPLYYYRQREGSISKSRKMNYDFVDAAFEQMVYVEKKYPRLKTCVHAAYASANMTIYNILLSNGSECTRKELLLLRRNVKENLDYVKEMPLWPKSKKIQCYLFVYNMPLYKIFYRMYIKIKKA